MRVSHQAVLGIVTALLSTIALSPPLIAATPDSIELRAKYEPGGTCTECFGWRASIRGDGTVVFEVKKASGWRAPDEWVQRPTPALSPRQLRHLTRIVDENRFMRLDAKYSAEYRDSNEEARIVTDQDTVVLEVTLRDAHTRVEIYGPELVAGIPRSEPVHKDHEAGRRFCRLWAEVLAVIPSPNTWQTARVYR
jgi:hypothetical protein